MGRVHVGAGVEIFPHAVVGKPPARSAALSRPPSDGGSVHLGDRCTIGAHSVIAEDVRIGHDTLVGDGASIRERNTIGARCVVGRGVSLHPDCVVGDGTRIMDSTHLATSTRIGCDCFISVHVSTVSDPGLGRVPFDARRVRGPALGDRVAVGAAAILLSGIDIGDDVTIGAGALVTRDVPAGLHMRGLPARPVTMPDLATT